VNQFSSWVDYYLLTGAMAGQLIGLVFVALSVGTHFVRKHYGKKKSAA